MLQLLICTINTNDFSTIYEFEDVLKIINRLQQLNEF